jgi:hypothetical protein
MADFGRGIKAGIVASIIYGIVWGLIIFLIPAVLFPGLWALPGFAAMWATLAMFTLIVIIIASIISGLIIGIIYAAAYNSLPTKSSYVKGMLVAIIFWIINLVLNLAWIGEIVYLILSFVFGVIVFGFLLGLFWNMFGGKNK